MITCKRTTTIGQKLTNYQHLALSKTQKQIEGEIKKQTNVIVTNAN